MASEELAQAVRLAKAGEKDSARRILLKLVEEEPQNELAWIWLVDTMPTDAQRIATLKQCLQLIPESKFAIQALANLQGRREIMPLEGQELQPEAFTPLVTDKPLGIPKPLSEQPTDVAIPPASFDGPSVGQGAEASQQPEPRGSRVDEVEKLAAALRPPGDQAPAVQPVEEMLPDQIQPLEERQRARRARIGLLAVTAALIVLAAAYTAVFSPRSPFHAVIFPPASAEPQLGLSSPQPEPPAALEIPRGLPQEEETAAPTLIVTEGVAEIFPTSTPSPPFLNLGGSEPGWLAWSGDGAWIAVLSGGGLSLFDSRELLTLRYLDLTEDGIQCRLADGGHRIACRGSSIQIWSLPDGDEVIRLDHPEYDEESSLWLAYAPDASQTAVVFDADPRTVWLWSASGTLLDVKLQAPTRIERLEYSPDGRYLAAGLTGGRVEVWSLAAYEQSILIAEQMGVLTGMEFSGNGNILALSDGQLVLVWDVPGQNLLRKFELPMQIRDLAVSPDGSLLALGTQTGQVLILDIESGQQAQSIEGPGSPVSVLAYSPQGERLAAAYDEGLIFFYDEMVK